jgi:hypothetical protein
MWRKMVKAGAPLPLLIFITACSLFQPSMDKEGQGAAKPEKEERAGGTAEKPVTVAEVERALIRLTIEMNMPGEFEDYRRGAEYFPDSLAAFFLLEEAFDEKGIRVRRAVYREDGRVYHRFFRFPLKDGEARRQSEDPALDRPPIEGAMVWRFAHEVEGEGFSFDVLIDGDGFPRELRYLDPAAGMRTVRSTRFDTLIAEAADGATRTETLRSLAREIQTGAEQLLPPYYQNLEPAGEEEIEEAGRPVDALRLSRDLGVAFGGELQVWYSREVRDGILRVRIGEKQRKVGIEEWNPPRR